MSLTFRDLVYVKIPAASAAPSTLCLTPTATSPIESVPHTLSTIVPLEPDIDQMTIIETLAWLKQGLVDMKEGLSKMVKLVDQCFDQVNSVLVEMKGAYNATSLQQPFQQSLKVQASLSHKMFGVEGSQGIQGILLNSLFMQSILNGMLQYIRWMPLQQF